MGMSASQARLIALTARMSDTEYEAQQVNQQRLTLSNKMNEVQEAAINMDVPTPPSKIDYQIESYSGRIGSNSVKIEVAETGGYKVTKTKKGFNANQGAGTLGTDSENNRTVDGAKVYSSIEAAIAANPDIKRDQIDNALNGVKNCFVENGWYTDETAKTVDTNAFAVIIDSDNKISFCLKTDTTNGDGTKIATYTATNGTYTVEAQDAEVKFDSNGNPSEVVYVDPETQKTETVKITANTTSYDELEYDAAMREYERQKIEYDREQNELNKKTSIYQRQDKQLELKLTRLDSERNALNTELEAIKKVVQDSIDRGFKTFSG